MFFKFLEIKFFYLMKMLFKLDHFILFVLLFIFLKILYFSNVLY